MRDSGHTVMSNDGRAVDNNNRDVRLNGFLELRRHCATLRELCVQSRCGYRGNVALLSGCLRSSVISTTNLAACVCVCVQNLTNFCPHAFISSPNVPKILFA